MDSRIQMKETSAIEQPAVNNLERKKQKRDSSRLSAFIYPRWSPQVATSWFTVTARQSPRRSAAWLSALRSESSDSNPLHVYCPCLSRS
ncbi:hypothetical protein AVEN_55388-1 [Araneus ventricosus]|uniref:Uncharacterized protein n=1 Tax=Araneus ventricosus TaxID=182803 RepID=A0A4Y2MJ64_ARAVE|nr:hypothetical protein AVEN_55388-1 [Araneus ventricosus]